jgi:hypothetical protein
MKDLSLCSIVPFDRYGAVMALTDIKTPISIAKSILQKCVHNVLAGEGALQFAVSQGFHKCSRDIIDEEGSGGDGVVRYIVLCTRIKVHRCHSIIFSIVFLSSQQHLVDCFSILHLMFKLLLRIRL